MFWNKKKKNAPRTEADLYTDALDAAFRVPKAAPVPMPKEVKRRRPMPKWLWPAIIGLAMLCVAAAVLAWFFALRPTRETERYLCLTVTDTSANYLYGIDDNDIYWRIDPGRADFDIADAEKGDTVWVYFDREGKPIEEDRDSALYTSSVTARDLHLCSYDKPPASLEKYGILFDTVRFDIDGDGMAETCRLFNGPTSGMLTYNLVAFGPLGLPEKQVTFYAPGAERDPAFYVKDGSLQILYADNRYAHLGAGPTAVGAWDVRMEDGQIALYAGNKQLDRIIDGELVRGTEIPTIPNITALNFKIYQDPAAGTSPYSASENIPLSHSQADTLVNKLRSLSWGSAEGIRPIGEITVYVGGSTFVYQFTPYGILLCGGQAALCPQDLWEELMGYLAVTGATLDTMILRYADPAQGNVCITLNEGSHSMTINNWVTGKGVCGIVGDYVILSFANSTELVTLRYGDDHMLFLQSHSSTALDLPDGAHLSVMSSPILVNEQGVLRFSLMDPILYMSPMDSIQLPEQETQSDLLTLSVDDTFRLESILNSLFWLNQGLSSQGFARVGTLYWTCGGTTRAIGFEADGTLLWDGNYAELSKRDWSFIWGLLQGLSKDMPGACFCADDLNLWFYESGRAALEYDGMGASMEYLRCDDLVLVKNTEHWLLLSLSSEDRLKLMGIGDIPAGRFSGVLTEIVPTLQLWLPGADPELMPPEVILSEDREMELLAFLANTFPSINPQTVERTGGRVLFRSYGYSYELYFDNDRTLTWTMGDEGVTKRLTDSQWQQFLQFLFPASQQQGARYRTLTDQGFLYINLLSYGSAEIYDGDRSLMGRWLMAGGLLYISVMEQIAPGDTAEVQPQIFVLRYGENGDYAYAAELSNQSTWELTDQQLFEQIYLYG